MFLTQTWFLARFCQYRLDFHIDAVRAKRPKRVPIVLSREEVRRIVGSLTGIQSLMARILYGGGLRASECVRLRIKDVDFSLHQIIVRDGKGSRDRLTVLPESLATQLQTHLSRVRMMHRHDLSQGYGSTYLPYSLTRKYPGADREWIW